MKHFLTFLITLITSLTFFASVAYAATSLSLESSTTSPRVNQSFDVTINISSTDNTLGTDVVLNYDPEFLQLNTVTPSTLYPNYSDVSGQTTTGKINISAVSDFSSGITPSDTFATLKFTPLKEGQTEISFAYGDTTMTGVIPFDGETPNLLLQAPPPLSLNIAAASPFTLNRAPTGAPANLRLPLTLAALGLLVLVVFLLMRRPRHTPSISPTTPPPPTQSPK